MDHNHPEQNKDSPSLKQVSLTARRDNTKFNLNPFFLPQPDHNLETPKNCDMAGW
jgi:hypothetical protein